MPPGPARAVARGANGGERRGRGSGAPTRVALVALARRFRARRRRGEIGSRMIDVAPHPLLDLASFVTGFPRPLGEMKSPKWLIDLLGRDAAAPLTPDEAVRHAVRDLLRHGGFKPTGRSKPASEYLRQADEVLGLPSINLAVDLCSAASMHSGLPISVLDLARTKPPLRVEVAPMGARYVFNAAGHAIELQGLLCLFDADGPCASPVKDAHRVKVMPETTRTLSLVWGTVAARERTTATLAWYRKMVARAGGDPGAGDLPAEPRSGARPAAAPPEPRQPPAPPGAPAAARKDTPPRQRPPA